MNRCYLTEAFKVPNDYRIPPNEALKFDTQHPELNSQEYCYEVSKYRAPKDYLPVYSSIRQNDHGLFIIATNDFTTCVNGGVLAGDYNFNNFATSDLKSAKFSAVHKDTLLDLYYLDDITFIATTSSNTIELYSTKAPVTLEKDNHQDIFCFIKIASKLTDGRVNCLSQFYEKNRMIIGTSNGHFECYECDSKELFQSFSLPYGHSAEITGIDTHPSVDLNWVSTSYDKSSLLWDRRQVHPASTLIDNHHDQLTDVKWIKDEIIILSDAVGNLMVFDTRNVKDPLSKTKVLNRSINSLNFDKSNKMFGVISESCNTYIYEIDEKNELKQIHEHNAHPNMLYSLCFDVKKPNTYYVVGEGKYAKEVTITQES
ncbi:methylosome protein WDR77-like [Chironomus tepperi]|uniref:methylosome protein WDR77-like n=1 Tax=Chironomus tepperi TaxID=113505 RepID=UPI00391EF530